MAQKGYKKTNEKTAPKIELLSLTTFGRLLTFIGKPAYKLIEGIIITFLSFCYITGHFTRSIFTFSLGLIKLTLTKPRKAKTKKKRKIETKTKQVIVYKTSRLKSLFYSAFLFLKSILSVINGFLGFLSRVIGVFKKPLTFLKILFLKLRLRFISIITPKIWIVKNKPKLTIPLVIMLITITIPLAIGYYLFYDLPSPKKLNERELEVSTKIYDRNGVLLFNIYKNKNRSLVALSEVPLQVRLATLAAEDAEFYSHPGFSIKGISRAIIKNVSEKKLSGGSTITQQLVKNALLTPEKTLKRKIRELVLSVWTEFYFTKDQILEMYLNEVPYGGTAYGIQEASQTYFGKSVQNLTLSEAALLAGLPKSPTKYSPYGATPKLALERQKEVIHLMKVNGFINENEEKKALEEKIEFLPNKISIKAPHFVMFVRQYLVDRYGEEMVETGGLHVTTTLDYQIQSLAEKALTEELDKIAKLNVKNGAVVVLNPKNGDILAMVGSKDFFDITNDGNVNVTTALRQPGSSIKVVNYTYALSNNFTPASILSDSPITYVQTGSPPYSPVNYDGGYRGNLSLRSALAESRNIPAVRVLASYGVGKMIEIGKRMGITTWNDPRNYGLSLTLGGGEVKLIDLANVYATLANGGKKPNLQPILAVTNYKGSVVEESSCRQQKDIPNDDVVNNQFVSDTYAKTQNNCLQEEAIDKRVAFLVTDILKDNDARTPSFGRNSALVIPGHPEVAVKTGTSNNLRDNLTLGYNQEYVVAVWVGNNDNSPMARVASGVTGASPVFQKIMSVLLMGKESIKWETPEGLVNLPICIYTGTLTCDGCPTKNEWFLQENKPQNHCSPELVKIINEDKSIPQLLPQAATVTLE